MRTPVERALVSFVLITVGAAAASTLSAAVAGNDGVVVSGRCDENGVAVFLATSDQGAGQMDADTVAQNVFILSSEWIKEPMWAYFPATGRFGKDSAPVDFRGKTSNGFKRGRTAYVRRCASLPRSLQEAAEAGARIAYATWVEDRAGLRDLGLWTQRDLDSQVEVELQPLLRVVPAEELPEFRPKMAAILATAQEGAPKDAFFDWRSLRVFKVEATWEALVKEAKKEGGGLVESVGPSEGGAEARARVTEGFKSIWREARVGDVPFLLIEQERLDRIVKDLRGLRSRARDQKEDQNVLALALDVSRARRAAHLLSEGYEVLSKDSSAAGRLKALGCVESARLAYPVAEIGRVLRALRQGFEAEKNNGEGDGKGKGITKERGG